MPVKMRAFRLSSHLLRWLAVAALIPAVLACSPRLESRGNLADPDRLASIQPGQHTRADVAELLGSPSSTSVFDEEVWYYISQRTETLAFLQPAVTDRQVVVVHFDKKGVVADVRTLGLEEGRDIEPVERETPTQGKELSAFKQLIGNFGRFAR